MDLRHLRYFQCVAEELSYSRAALRLRVAQPALSRAVMELEEHLGVTLFDRSRQRIRITPAGEVLRRETAILLERWEEAMRRVRRTAVGEEGELRLGYIGPPTKVFLGRLLTEYHRLYPLVDIHLEERTPERVWEMVARGRLSVAITRPVPSHHALGLGTAPLREEPLGVVVNAEHEWAGRKWVNWKLLHEVPLVVLARREGMGLHDAVLAGCRRAGVVPKLVQTPSLIGTVFSYVEAGLGVGVVTDSVVEEGSSLRFIPLRPIRTVPLVLVWNEDRQSPPVERFRDLVMRWKTERLLWRTE